MSNIGDKTVVASDVDLTIYADQEKRNVASLIQYSGEKVGKCYHLDISEDGATLRLGRSAESDICVEDNGVSRKHLQLAVREGDILAKDLDSANGTFLNDVCIEGEVILKDGDFLRLGTVLLKYFNQDNLDGIIQDKIYRMATIDSGTQTFNKKYILDTLESELRSHHNRRIPLSIIYFDLDHFKQVNDTYGHNAGDLVLKETAKIVSEVIRKDDTLGRFGGEEFVVVLPNTDLEICKSLAERIRRAIATHNYLLTQDDGEEVNHKQTVSLGVYQLDDTITTVEKFLEQADRRLYLSKSSGRNRVTA